MAQAIISWAEAKAAGLQRYFNGKPCKYGHIAERYVSARKCLACRDIENAARDKDKLNAGARRRHAENPARMIEHQRAYTKRHPDKARAKWARDHAESLKRQPAWADKYKIGMAYELATFLTEETGELWHVDHEIPLRGERVSGLHVHENLRPMRASENIRKSNKFEITT